jgi:hypothetical protein
MTTCVSFVPFVESSCAGGRTFLKVLEPLLLCVIVHFP